MCWSRIFLRLQQLKQIGLRLASSAHPTRARRRRPLPKLLPLLPPGQIRGPAWWLLRPGPRRLALAVLRPLRPRAPQRRRLSLPWPRSPRTGSSSWTALAVPGVGAGGTGAAGGGAGGDAGLLRGVPDGAPCRRQRAELRTRRPRRGGGGPAQPEARLLHVRGGLVLEDVVAREAGTAEAVVDLMARSTECLIEAFCVAAAESAGAGKGGATSLLPTTREACPRSGG